MTDIVARLRSCAQLQYWWFWRITQHSKHTLSPSGTFYSPKLFAMVRIVSFALCTICFFRCSEFDFVVHVCSAPKFAHSNCVQCKQERWNYLGISFWEQSSQTIKQHSSSGGSSSSKKHEILLQNFCNLCLWWLIWMDVCDTYLRICDSLHCQSSCCWPFGE